MKRAMRTAMLFVGIGVIAAIAADTAQGARKRTRERERERAPVEQPVDRRDRTVKSAGSPFHAKPYWQALGACGGMYFRLNSLHEDAAAVAQVVKRNREQAQTHREKAEEARRIATAFFDGAERVLAADRDIGRADAILTYDAAARAAGEGLKGIEAAIAATKPCPALYETCRKAMPKICPGLPASAARSLPR
jgi:hypothetical protein